jgi:hypothetical protein
VRLASVISSFCSVAEEGQGKPAAKAARLAATASL